MDITVKIADYKNGNTSVTILSDGTKVREWDGVPMPDVPESIDVKVSDYCDLACPFCHEQSTRGGAHADLDKLIQVISGLPRGVELAIGGGNPLAHPRIEWLLEQLKSCGFIPNITVNQRHLTPFRNLLYRLIDRGLVYGIGVSISKPDNGDIKALVQKSLNVVFHTIAGVTDFGLAKSFCEFPNSKILVLGYKRFGFGEKYYSDKVEDSIALWKRNIPLLIGKCILSFDNLAIEQLGVKRLLTKEGWEQFYMGDDFHFTMYVDAVAQQYAPTSRSEWRVGFNEMTLIEFFQSRR